MGAVKRSKMPISERAKQFSPFSALRGLEEALQKKEEELSLVTKPELSPEREAEINQKLKELQNGDRVKITYYCLGQIITVTDEFISLSRDDIELQENTIRLTDILDVK